MRCDEFEPRLNEVLDERRTIDSDAELREHAACCAACRQLSRGYSGVLAGFAAMETPYSNAPSAARTWLEPSRERTWRNGGRTAALLAMAAVLLIAVWVARRNHEVVAPESLAEGNVPNEAHPLREPALGDGDEQVLGQLVKRAPDKYWLLANDARASFDRAAQLVPGLAGSDVLGGGESTSPSESAAGDESSDWMAAVSDGFRPVTRSTASALSLFWSALPDDDEEPRS